jgi:hypothetical protein
MPTFHYALEKNGTPIAVITWQGTWQNVVVQYNGQQVGRVANIEEMRQGRSFSLADGSTLRVQLVNVNGYLTALQVFLNDKELAWLDDIHIQTVVAAVLLLRVIGILGVLFGIVQLFGTPANTNQQSILTNISSIIVGAVLFACSRYMSRTYAVNSVLIAMAASLGLLLEMVIETPNEWIVALPIGLLLILLLLAYRDLRALNKA